MMSSFLPLRRLIVWAIFCLQRLLLYVAYFIFGLAPRQSSRTSWVVGIDEIAANVHNIADALAPSISVSLTPHPFYNYTYDYSLPTQQRHVAYLFRAVYGPLLLARLVYKADGFFYVGGSGFLLNEIDGRAFEFDFLKSRGKLIACFFCGSEIRSIKKMTEFSKKIDMDVVTTYQVATQPFIASDYKESIRRRLADAASQYADDIFNAPIDQMSYIERDVHPFIYFHPQSHFSKRPEEFFMEAERLRVLHAPSSPFIKGTPLVRAAIKKLKEEGYDFEYTELIGVPNTEVLAELMRAHIVLNEFYAFVPGQFGIEAMAAHCALLTSADEEIETSLPSGSNKAWMVTRYWRIYENLKALLNDRQLVRQYADSGYAWAQENAAYESTAKKLRDLLSPSV